STSPSRARPRRPPLLPPLAPRNPSRRGGRAAGLMKGRSTSRDLSLGQCAQKCAFVRGSRRQERRRGGGGAALRPQPSQCVPICDSWGISLPRRWMTRTAVEPVRARLETAKMSDLAVMDDAGLCLVDTSLGARYRPLPSFFGALRLGRVFARPAALVLAPSASRKPSPRCSTPTP